MTATPTVPPDPRPEHAEVLPPPPVRRCACGRVIGDGDYVSGHRWCVFCRRIGPLARR